MIPILFLAAGRSSRMGSADKLLERVDGVPLLTLLCRRAMPLGPVFVTLPAPDHPRASAIPDGVTSVAVDGEMSDSIRAGLRALPQAAQGVILMPSDMPDITGGDLAAIKSAVTPRSVIVRAATEDGKPGHPIYFARSVFKDLEALTGDRGAFRICADHEHQTDLVPLKGQRARLDLDTPEDWARYRANRS